MSEGQEGKACLLVQLGQGQLSDLWGQEAAPIQMASTEPLIQ